MLKISVYLYLLCNITLLKACPALSEASLSGSTLLWHDIKVCGKTDQFAVFFYAEIFI